MSDEAKPKPPTRTRPCPQCGKNMPANRNVCAECGHVSTWFKVRVAVGCASLALGGGAILLSIATALWGPGAAQ